MSSGPRDLYIPADCWKTIVDAVAPKPRGMDPAFVKAVEPFKRYAATITGEIGESIQRCRDHLERFLASAQETVAAEAGSFPERLGRPKTIPYGQDSLSFQIFNYRGTDSVNIREDRLAALLTQYDLFLETMKFMERKVEEGDLGILRNSFLFIHKPLHQAAELMSAAIQKMPIEITTKIGEPADPHYVHIAGVEACEDVPPACICRILKPGYVFEGREIQEGVVIVAEKVPSPA